MLKVITPTGFRNRKKKKLKKATISANPGPEILSETDNSLHVLQLFDWSKVTRPDYHACAGGKNVWTEEPV